MLRLLLLFRRAGHGVTATPGLAMGGAGHGVTATPGLAIGGAGHGVTATPQGWSPTAIDLTTSSRFTSITEMSFDTPLVV